MKQTRKKHRPVFKAGLVIEALLTFFLVFVILPRAVDPRGPSHLAPVANRGRRHHRTDRPC